MLYLANHTNHRWHQFMSERCWCQKMGLAPQGRTIFNNVNSVYSLLCDMGEWAHYEVVAEYYLDGGQGCCAGPHSRFGKLSLSKVPIEG